MVPVCKIKDVIINNSEGLIFMTEKISRLIDELLNYGIKSGLVDKEDTIYTRNKLLEFFKEQEYTESTEDKIEERQLSDILEDMVLVLYEKKIMPEDTITYKDLYDTALMGLLTPAPSVVRRRFADELAKSPKEATDFYYDFSKATNYIRVDRIKRMKNGKRKQNSEIWI